jgi:hypothetical protein
MYRALLVSAVVPTLECTAFAFVVPLLLLVLLVQLLLIPGTCHGLLLLLSWLLSWKQQEAFSVLETLLQPHLLSGSL